MAQLTDLKIVEAGSITKDVNRQYTTERKWQVYYDSATSDFQMLSGVKVAIGGIRLDIGLQHPDCNFLAINNLSASCSDSIQPLFLFDDNNVPNPNNGVSAYLWTITGKYGPYDPLTALPANPLDMKPTFRIDYYTEEAPLWMDKSKDESQPDSDSNVDKPILNAAFDVYDPPVKEERIKYVIRIRRNEDPTTFNFFTAMQLGNKINKLAWNGIDPYCAKTDPFTLPEVVVDQESQVRYYPMEYIIKIDPDGWDEDVINAGVRELGSTGLRKQIFVSGVPASSPVLLDGSGHALPTPVDPSAVVIDSYRKYRAIDFSSLNFDNLFTFS